MGVRKVNLLACELEDEPVPDRFRHRETVLGPALGAERLGASIYEGAAGTPIWPYHYHYGIEEWLFVLSGNPVLRDPAGRRQLRAGDLVAFPSGHTGAHTVEGPGRFIIFSSDDARPTHLAVYPDSDKMAVAPGETAAEGMDFMIVQRGTGVDYWQGEAEEAGPEPAEMVRQPESGPARPVINALEVEGPVGEDLGAGLLDGAVLVVAGGEEAAPYHFVFGREEWVIVLDGEPTLRHPDGEEELAQGDVVAFPEGPAGARRFTNRADRAARLLSLSTTGLPVNVCYPDSGRWLIRNTPDEELLLVPGDSE